MVSFFLIWSAQAGALAGAEAGLDADAAGGAPDGLSPSRGVCAAAAKAANRNAVHVQWA